VAQTADPYNVATENMTLAASHIPPGSWPDSLDALIAAPRHHSLVFENERVRVVETQLPPGEIVPVHAHRWPCVLLIHTWSDLLRRDAEGTILLDTRQLPQKPILDEPQWQPPLPPHSLENIGSVGFSAVQIEIKGAL